MDFRRLEQIPESFYLKSEKMCEDNDTDFFLQPHVFTYDGVEYTISMSKRDMGVLLQHLRYEGAETEGEMNTFYAGFFHVLVQRFCRWYNSVKRGVFAVGKTEKG